MTPKKGKNVVARTVSIESQAGEPTLEDLVRRLEKMETKADRAEEIQGMLDETKDQIGQCPSRVKLSKGVDKPEISKAAKLGSWRESSAKASDQAQNRLRMSGKAEKGIAENVQGKNIAFETTADDESKEAEPRGATSKLAEDVRGDNMPVETAERSKEAELREGTSELAEDVRRENMPVETTTIVTESRNEYFPIIVPAHICCFFRYLYADLYAGAIWAATEDPENSGNFSTSTIPFSCARDSPLQCSTVPDSALAALGYIYSFGQDNSKDIYLLTSSGVYRVATPSRCNYSCSKENVTAVASPSPTTSPPSHANQLSPVILLSALLLFMAGLA
ncbi:hypothetical protein GQ457_04G016050 [Hibiscus cannabinus]